MGRLKTLWAEGLPKRFLKLRFGSVYLSLGITKGHLPGIQQFTCPHQNWAFFGQVCPIKTEQSERAFLLPTSAECTCGPKNKEAPVPSSALLSSAPSAPFTFLGAETSSQCLPKEAVSSGRGLKGREYASNLRTQRCS